MSGESNPFQITSSRGVYENSWVKVVEHQVINPRGNAGIYGVVLFKNRAVGVIPYENGNIWLVGQYRFPLNQYSWEIPEGGSPENEELEDSARRELREETGLSAKTLVPILRMHLSNSVTNEFGVVYLATRLSAGVAAPEETEQLKIQQISLETAYDQVKQGKITDALTVAGILKLVLMRNEGELAQYE